MESATEVYPYAHAQHGIDGIHYDVNTNIVELSGTNVSTGDGYVTPRTGIAYRIDEKTVFRAGFGINTNSESFRNNVQTYPEVISATYTGANSFSAPGNLTTGFPPLVGPDYPAARSRCRLTTPPGLPHALPPRLRGNLQHHVAARTWAGPGSSRRDGWERAISARAPA